MADIQVGAAELEFLKQQAVDAAAVKTLPQVDPRYVREWDPAAKEIIETPVIRRRRDDLETLDDLVRYVGMNNVRGGVGEGESATTSSIWVSRPEVAYDFQTLRLISLKWLDGFNVVYLPEDGDRLAVVRVPLTVSPWVIALMHMLRADAKPLDHAQFLEWIERIGTVEEYGAVLRKLSKIKAVMGSSRESDLSFGKQKGRAEFERELVGAEEVPETMDFAGSFFTDPVHVGCRFNVKVKPEFVNGDDVRFRLALSSEAIEATVGAAVEKVRGYLAEKIASVLTFIGVPQDFGPEK